MISPKDMEFAGLPDAHEYLDALSPKDLQSLIDAKIKRQEQRIAQKAEARRLKANKPKSSRESGKSEPRRESQLASAFVSAAKRQNSIDQKQEKIFSEIGTLRKQLEGANELKETSRKRNLNVSDRIVYEKRLADVEKKFRQRVEEMSANRAGDPMTQKQINEEVALLMRNAVQAGRAPVFTTKLSKRKQSEVNQKIDRLERQALELSSRKKQLDKVMRSLVSQMSSETYSQQVAPKLKTIS